VKARGATPGDLAAAFSDASPAVRAAAFGGNLPGAKDLPKETRAELLATARGLLTTDADPEVRRSALQWLNEFPKEDRGALLELARNDTDPYVRITAWSRSPEAAVRTNSAEIVAGLESGDIRVRDAAWRIVSRTLGVDVPYRAGWNPRARERAVARIREALGNVAPER
jgi:hypothetical protein